MTLDKSSKIMVTGANGHVGFNLLKMLKEMGYINLRASVRDANDSTKTTALKALGITDIVSLDILNADTFASVSQGIDVLFHVAATYRIHTSGGAADRQMIDDSVIGTRSAMNAAAQNKIAHVVMTSSTVTMPTAIPGQTLPDETEWRTDLQVPYMRAKVEAEKLAWDLAEEHDIKLATILPGAILGPNFGKGTQSTDFIKAMMMGSMRMGTIGIYFPVIDVRDVARAHILAAEQGVVGRFAAVSDVETAPKFVDLLKLMRTINTKVPKPMMVLPQIAHGTVPLVDWLMNKLIGSPRTVTRAFMSTLGAEQVLASNAKAKSVLGWKPIISLEQTLRDTMAELST